MPGQDGDEEAAASTSSVDKSGEISCACSAVSIRELTPMAFCGVTDFSKSWTSSGVVSTKR